MATFQLPDEVFGLVKEFLLPPVVCLFCRKKCDYKWEWSNPINLKYPKFSIDKSIKISVDLTEEDALKEAEKKVTIEKKRLCICYTCYRMDEAARFAPKVIVEDRDRIKDFCKYFHTERITNECKTKYAVTDPHYQKKTKSWTTRKINKYFQSYDWVFQYQECWKEFMRVFEVKRNLLVDGRMDIWRNEKRRFENKNLNQRYYTELARQLTVGEIDYEKFGLIIQSIRFIAETSFTQRHIDEAEEYYMRNRREAIESRRLRLAELYTSMYNQSYILSQF